MESNGESNEAAPVSVDKRKLFVGGLSQETKEEHVKEYFSQYGTIESINLKTDAETGNSRGFAFIVFTSADALDSILAVEEHNINNKKVDVQKAKTKQGKLFVGGITPEMSEDDIKNHFSQFGNLVQAEFPFDKTRNERKKFCFIIFETEQTVNDIVKTRKQTINSVEVDVKKAVTNDQNRGGNFRGGFRGRGGRGRGFGPNFKNYNYNYGYNNWDQGYGGGYDDGYGGGGGYNGNGGGYGYGGGFHGKQRGGARGRGVRHQPY